MENPVEMAQVKIYVSSTDTFHGTILYEAITIEAKNFGILGATVYKGMIGYGTSSRHTEKKFWEIVEKVPVIIEMNDEREILMRFVNHIRPWFIESQKGHLATISPTEIVMKKSGTSQHPPKADPDFVP
jgi:hypothetical protein